MKAIVGFTLSWNIEEPAIKRASIAQQKALDHFQWLNKLSLHRGEIKIDVWGHGEISNLIHKQPDGSTLILIGSPVGNISWSEVERLLNESDDFMLPWEGRVILLRINPDGKSWTMWNDWLGSIPVCHSQVGQGQIASTLEPVVVAANGYTSADIFMPGLVMLLIHGCFFDDWTLFKGMHALPADCKAEWGESGFRWKRQNTVKPSDERWAAGWDDLVDEMHELSRSAIANVLKTQSEWILPLSAGLDSRLIAVVGAELGTDLHTYTWGAPESGDAVYSRQIARTLDLPWKWIKFHPDSIVNYTPVWSDLFGSWMDFHGVYMMPFLDATQAEMSSPYVSGFIGEAVAGFDVKFQNLFHASPDSTYQMYPENFIRWRPDEVRSLLRIPVDDAFEDVASAIQRNKNLMSGPGFQRLRFLTFWGRQRFFTNYQVTLSAYWKGVAAPFMDRTYAQFCLSLPRSVLEDRRLQADVYRRYYPEVAAIPGTFGGQPFVIKGERLLMNKIFRNLPKIFHRGPVLQYVPLSNRRTWDYDSLRAHGYDALRPIREARDLLSGWLNLDMVDAAYEEGLRGDLWAIMKLKAIQPLALRLLGNWDERN